MDVAYFFPPYNGTQLPTRHAKVHVTTVDCPTGDSVLDIPAIRDSLRALWQRANYAVDTPQVDRKETGGFIVLDVGGNYTFQAFQGGVSSPCGLDFPPDYAPPAGAIAFVHTHQWRLNELQTSCAGITFNGVLVHVNYGGHASEDDEIIARDKWHIPGYILDASGTTKFDGVNQEDRHNDPCWY